MLILAIIVFGILVGAIAQLILGTSFRDMDWPVAFGTGIAGSFIGGLLSSLISGDGIAIAPSGLIGSVVGAVIAGLVWNWWQRRNAS